MEHGKLVWPVVRPLQVSRFAQGRGREWIAGPLVSRAEKAAAARWRYGSGVTLEELVNGAPGLHVEDPREAIGALLYAAPAMWARIVAEVVAGRVGPSEYREAVLQSLKWRGLRRGPVRREQVLAWERLHFAIVREMAPYGADHLPPARAGGKALRWGTYDPEGCALAHAVRALVVEATPRLCDALRDDGPYGDAVAPGAAVLFELFPRAPGAGTWNAGKGELWSLLRRVWRQLPRPSPQRLPALQDEVACG